jgi:hypothetical protein
MKNSHKPLKLLKPLYPMTLGRVFNQTENRKKALKMHCFPNNKNLDKTGTRNRK